MRKYVPAFLAVVAALPLCAFGQSSATYVSALGSDSNACTATAPCLTFNGAIGKTSAGGTIFAQTSGNFGPVAVTKSVTIDGGGVASISIPNYSNGVLINAGASDSVVLRGLSLAAAGPNGFGMQIQNAGSVQLQNVSIANAVYGIVSNPNGTLNLALDNVIATGNGVGLFVQGAAQNSPTKLIVTNSNFSNSTNASIAAVDVEAYVNGTFRNTTASNNQGIAYLFQGNNQGALFECVATANAGAALIARATSGTSIVRIGGNRFTANGSAITVGANGLVGTYSDNEMSGQVSGTLTVLSRQ